MPSYEWITQSRLEGIGKLIKEVINKLSDEQVGAWYEDLKTARENIIADGKFSKHGIDWLDKLAFLEKTLISEPKDKKRSNK